MYRVDVSDRLRFRWKRVEGMLPHRAHAKHERTSPLQRRRARRLLRQRQLDYLQAKLRPRFQGYCEW